VDSGAVSLECSEAIYGVVLKGSPLQVDSARTAALRQEIRKKRLGMAVYSSQEARHVEGDRLLPMGEYLEVVVVGDRLAVRCKCGCDLGDVESNWKDRAALLRLESKAAGPRRKLHHDLEMVAFLCPLCGTFLSVDVKKRDDPILFDAELETRSLKHRGLSNATISHRSEEAEK
jgi:acetone carboxylase gamma subunit